MKFTTVDDLVDQVRSQLDEYSDDAVDTQRDIVPALNRGSDKAFGILVKHYVDPLVTYVDVTLDADGKVPRSEIPNAFEDRVLSVEAIVPGVTQRRDLSRITYRRLGSILSTSTTNYPEYYAIVGRDIVIAPTPVGGGQVRIWYARQPDNLVTSDGRITTVNDGAGYIVVDSVGPLLTTEADQLRSYINVVDGLTGEVRGSYQIKTITDNRIVLKTTPTRTSVLGRTITPVAGIGDVARPDDHICFVSGSCVPYFDTPINQYLIQFAVASIMRSRGGPADMELRILGEFEQDIRRTWAGRESQMRIRKSHKSPWSSTIRR